MNADLKLFRPDVPDTELDSFKFALKKWTEMFHEIESNVLLEIPSKPEEPQMCH